MHALDSPVTAVEGEQTLRRSFLGRTTGDAEGDFPGFLSGFLAASLAFDQKDLSDLREVEVVIECRTTPDSSGFDSSVIRRRDLDKVGGFPVLEGERDIALQRWLIAFDREVIMRSGRDDKVGNTLLGQEGVGGDIFPGDIDRFEQGDRHPDFIGSFGFLPGVSCLDGQGIHFFWV